ncbi:MAG TPA: PilN domain-containing protein [Solirubrobacteraceae bacterium]|nr:PilN domain-containing protein [Solirubrobacteraceae bacterium]
MRAVNLIPDDARKAGRTRGTVAIGRPSSAYVVLAVLALAVLMSGAWALTSKTLSENTSDLARVEQEARSAEAKVAGLAPYKEFAALKAARVETISELVKGRFDWSHGLREVARVIPADVDITSLVGTTSPTSTVEGAGGGGSLRAALPVPAIDLIGCARSQGRVAQLLARLRAIDGVQRVTLSSSEKADSASLSDTDCRRTTRMPQFQLTVFFQAQPGLVPAATATTASAPATTSTGGAT